MLRSLALFALVAACSGACYNKCPDSNSYSGAYSGSSSCNCCWGVPRRSRVVFGDQRRRRRSKPRYYSYGYWCSLCNGYGTESNCGCASGQCRKVHRSVVVFGDQRRRRRTRPRYYGYASAYGCTSENKNSYGGWSNWQTVRSGSNYRLQRSRACTNPCGTGCHGALTDYTCHNGAFTSDSGAWCQTWRTCSASQYQSTSPTNKRNRGCTTYSGSCSNGWLISSGSRRQHDHCGSCKNGYYLNNKQCKAWRSACAANQYESTTPSGTQNRACTTYGGSCDNGTLITSSSRRQNNHCGTCNSGYKLHNRSCKKNCVVGAFSNWSSCTKSCSSGSQSRSRTLTEPEEGGVACPHSAETQGCNHGPCPVHCATSAFSAWSTCTKSCGNGVQSRSRTVTTTNLHGGYVCPYLKETRNCNQAACATDCVVAAWNAWEPCSVTCGGGVQHRHRTHVEPTFGGEACPAYTESRSCSNIPCQYLCAATTCQYTFVAGEWRTTIKTNKCSPLEMNGRSFHCEHHFGTKTVNLGLPSTSTYTAQHTNECACYCDHSTSSSMVHHHSTAWDQSTDITTATANKHAAHVLGSFGEGQC